MRKNTNGPSYWRTKMEWARSLALVLFNVLVRVWEKEFVLVFCHLAVCADDAEVAGMVGHFWIGILKKQTNKQPAIVQSVGCQRVHVQAAKFQNNVARALFCPCTRDPEQGSRRT